MREPGSIENEVLIGRNGYLFLAGGAHRVFDIVTGQQTVAEPSYGVFRNNLETRLAWATQHGAQFMHVVMPDKQSIIPEEWPLTPPLRIGREYLRRLPDLNKLLMYPVDRLSELRSCAVSKVDTHLTDFGSAIVASLIVEHLTGESQSEQVEFFMTAPKGERSSAGDLGSKLNPPATETLEFLSLQPPGIWLHNGITGGNNGIVDLRYNSNARYQKRIALFGDSFGRDIARYLQFWYSEVFFFRSGYFHTEIAALLKPDVVLTENVERYLDNCQSDADAAEFLDYPTLHSDSYRPSREFLNAFAAAARSNVVSECGVTAGNSLVYDACILFAYHKVDALTLHHLDLLKRHNPGIPVVPITDDVPEHLPDGFDVKAFPDRWPKTKPWRRSDTMLYRWFLNRNLTARRYLWFEYDVRCTVAIRDAYARVWDADIATRDFMRPGQMRDTRFGKDAGTEWRWFKEICRLREEDQKYAAGIVPLACTLFSHGALEGILANLAEGDIFCELRIGTAVAKAGLRVQEFPEPLRSGIRWDGHIPIPRTDGIFHAVKMIDDPVPVSAHLNMALYRPASQSSISYWSRKQVPTEDATGANNGVIDAQPGFNTDKERDPWWQVDLERPCLIDKINLYNRQECAERLRNFKILSSIDAEQWTCVFHKSDREPWGYSSPAPYVVAFAPKIRARFIRVVLDGFDFLHFCECEVIGQAISPGA